jgi:hypothetical protein
LKLVGSGRRFVELADGRQQFRQLVLCEFFVELWSIPLLLLPSRLISLGTL